MGPGDKQRADLLVIQPFRVNHVDDNRLSGAPAPEKLLDHVVRSDVHLPSVAGTVTAALGRVCHENAPGGTPAHRQFVHARIFHFSGGVPTGMERKEQPILIVVETRIDFILHVVRLAAELRAHVGNLYRIACLVFSLIGDPVGFGLPDPALSDFESGNVYVEGGADRINLPERVDAISLSNFFGGWRTLLRPGSRSQNQQPANEKTDLCDTAGIFPESLSFENRFPAQM